MTRVASSDALEQAIADDELLTGEAVVLSLRPASFVLRAAGALIDIVVYLGAYISIMLLLASASLSLDIDEAFAAAVAVAGLVSCLVIAPTAVETVSHGKSLGKLAVGARIVRDDGGAIGFRHAFIRALTGVLELFLTIGGLAAMVALLNGKSKRLGDLLAGTYSQYERVAKVTPPVYGVPVELRDWAVTADVAKLPDALARRIAQFLRHASSLTPATRERLSVELSREAGVFVSPLPAVKAELFLAAVSAVRRDREARALASEAERLATLAPVLRGLPHDFPDR